MRASPLGAEGDTHVRLVGMYLDRAQRIARRARDNARLVCCGRVLAAGLVIVGSLDVVSTNAALAVGHVEGNPLLQSLQADMGAWWALPKLVFHLALASLILWTPSVRTLAVAGLVNAAYVLLVLNNFYFAGWLL